MLAWWKSPKASCHIARKETAPYRSCRHFVDIHTPATLTLGYTAVGLLYESSDRIIIRMKLKDEDGIIIFAKRKEVTAQESLDQEDATMAHRNVTDEELAELIRRTAE